MQRSLYFLLVIFCFLTNHTFSQDLALSSEQPKKSANPFAPVPAEPISKFRDKAEIMAGRRLRGLYENQVGEGVVSINAYADFGYVYGPQGKHRYYDYITKDTVQDYGRRDYTSYPLYANQFSLAYGYVQAQYEIKDKLRVRAAFHSGHIVESLYNEEMKSMQNVRELAIYYFLTPKLAVEAGIFPSYYGFEIVLNKENLHATRAYIADFTPDYEAGARLHWHINQHHTLRFQVLNGWQEIRESNGKKALGLVWSINKPNRIVGDWNVYLGDESPLGASYQKWRHYHNAYYKIWVGKRWIVAPVIDYVMEQNPFSPTNSWVMDWKHVVAPALSLRYKITDRHGIAARWDNCYNPSDIVPELRTGLANGWQTNSYTLTLEYVPMRQITFRAEGRYGYNKDAVFRGRQNEPVREDWYGIVSAAFHF